MAKKTVQKFVEQAQKAYSKKCTDGSGLVEMGIRVEQAVSRRSIKRALIWLGFGLAFLSLACGDSWVVESPLFNLVGSVTCFVFLLLCWVAGGIWWLVRGSSEVCAWLGNLMPFCVQPYRSISSIPVIFIAIGIACDKCLWFCNRMPWSGECWHVFLEILRWGLWIMVVVAWLVAVILTFISLIRIVD